MAYNIAFILFLLFPSSVEIKLALTALTIKRNQETVNENLLLNLNLLLLSRRFSEFFPSEQYCSNCF